VKPRVSVVVPVYNEEAVLPGLFARLYPALDALGFPPDTRTRVEAGQFVEVALPTSSERDLNVGIAFLVATRSPAAVARTVREEKRVLHADPTVTAWGDLEGEGTAAALEGLRLTPAQLTAFGHAAPGTDANLSRDEIAALCALEHARHERTARADAIAELDVERAAPRRRHRRRRSGCIHRAPVQSRRNQSRRD